MSLNLHQYHPKDIACQSSLFALNNKVESGKFNIEDVGDLIPGSVMVQDLSKLTNLYMNKNGCEVLNRSKEELNCMGSAYFDTFFPPQEIEILKVEISKFIQREDHSAIYSFFQRVRPDNKSDYKWYLSNVRLYTPVKPGESVKLLNVAIAVDNILYASKKINSICEQTEYAQRNFLRFTSLTKREKEIIKLIASGYNSRYISESLFISLHTVNNHRKSILHKLSTKSIIELIKFAAVYNIV